MIIYKHMAESTEDSTIFNAKIEVETDSLEEYMSALNALRTIGKTVDCCIVKAIPAADVVERKRGEWIDHCVRDWHCSECGKQVPKQVRFDGYCYDDKLNFCPNCGADMRGENNG